MNKNMKAKKTLNAIPKNLADFISKNDFGRTIEGVLVTPEKIVATDSFKLLEITLETGAPEGASYITKLPKGLKTFETVTRAESGDAVEFCNKGAKYTGAIIAGEFPDYVQIMPTAEPVHSFNLTPEHLKAIADAFQDGATVTMHCYAEGKPLMFSNKDATKRALLMPQIR